MGQNVSMATKQTTCSARWCPLTGPALPWFAGERLNSALVGWAGVSSESMSLVLRRWFTMRLATGAGAFACQREIDKSVLVSSRPGRTSRALPVTCGDGTGDMFRAYGLASWFAAERLNSALVGEAGVLSTTVFRRWFTLRLATGAGAGVGAAA